MKQCAFIGTCQLKAISDILSKCSDFTSEYEICKVILVHSTSKEDINNFFTNELKDVDLVICQPVSPKYRKGLVSTKRLLEYKPKSCQTILVPYLYFDGYFPSIIYLKDSQNKKVYKNGLIYHDKNVIKHLLNKIDVKKSKGVDTYLNLTHKEEVHVKRITNILNDKYYYGKNQTQRIINETVKILEYRELSPYDYKRPVDIIMSDYIKNNYNKTRLFFTMNHPTNDTLIELSKRILSHLEINSDLDFLHNLPEYLDDVIFPIYPSLIHNLNLEFKSDCYISNKCIIFDEFIKIYVKSYFKNIKISTLIHNYLL